MTEYVYTLKLTPEQARKSKAAFAKRLREEWEKARAAGNRYFWLYGKVYSTKKKGESDALWAKNFKDNLTVSGQPNAKVNAATGWEDTPGYNAGTHNSKGEWMTFHSLNEGANEDGVPVPIGIRGDYDSSYRGWLSADRPTDEVVVVSGGSNRGNKGVNKRTGVVIGDPDAVPREPVRDRPKTNREANAEADKVATFNISDFMDAVSIPTAVGNGITALIDGVTGTPFLPQVYVSGLNPFGYGKDLSNIIQAGQRGAGAQVWDSTIDLGMRGLDAYTMAGSPGAAALIDRVGTKVAPKLGEISFKSTYIPKGGTMPIVDDAGNIVMRVPNSWNQMTLTRGGGPMAHTAIGDGVNTFGQRSMQRALQEGTLEGMSGLNSAARWGNAAWQNANTGTTYVFRNIDGAGNLVGNAYDNAVEAAMQGVPWFNAATDAAVQVTKEGFDAE